MNKLARLAASLQRAATTSGVVGQPQVRRGPITPAGARAAWVVTAQPAAISREEVAWPRLGGALAGPVRLTECLAASWSTHPVRGGAARGALGGVRHPQQRGLELRPRFPPWQALATALTASNLPPRPLRCPPTLQAAWAAVKTGLSAAHYATLQGDQLTDFLEHTTGPEREELEAKAKGVENPWHEAWWVLLPPLLPLLPVGCACWRGGRKGWREVGPLAA